MIELNIGNIHISIGKKKVFSSTDVNVGGVDKTCEIVGHEEKDGTKTIDYVTFNDPRLKRVMTIAEARGWRPAWHRPEEMRVRFVKGKNMIVDVWYSKMTVGTVVTHPKKGRTQLFRRHVSERLLEEIFENPRVHTGNGYYER